MALSLLPGWSLGCVVDFGGGAGQGDGGPRDGAVALDASALPDGMAPPDGGPGCGPASCAGCCGPGGMCHLGLADSLCGVLGEPCQDCTATEGTRCQEGRCEEIPCLDGDGDGRGEGCALGPDFCDDDPFNWTESGCTSCRDQDGDGVRGTGCDLPEDPCDNDPFNWTQTGCSACRDADGDGLRGTDCDLAEDCDDNAPGVAVPCQANGCPQGWVHIPAGAFQRGCNAGELGDTCEAAEQPRHTAILSGYCMQETEVSVAMFRACKTAGVCSGDAMTTEDNSLCNLSAGVGAREQHPINCIPWADSRQLCQAWLGGDLPTEAQWEKAARGADPDVRRYPWGDTPEPGCTRTNYNYCHSSVAPVTWPVGHLSTGAGDSPYGLKDMSGNLWEWTLDQWSDTVYSQCAGGCTDPVNQGSGTHKVIRGGGFHHPIPAYHRVVHRDSQLGTAHSLNQGFRCRRSL